MNSEWSDHFGCLGHLHAETPRDQEKEVGYLSDSEREYKCVDWIVRVFVQPYWNR